MGEGNVRIPELAVVEVSRPEQHGRATVVIGMVVSAREQDDCYQVEVVDPRSGQSDVVLTSRRDLRLKHVV
jgi:hypothetical protein